MSGRARGHRRFIPYRGRGGASSSARPVSINLNTETVGTDETPNTLSNTASQSGTGPTLSIFLETVPGEPEAWKLYMPQESFAIGCPTALKVEAMENFFRGRKLDYEKVRILCWFNVDVQAITLNETFMNAWDDFETDLKNNAEFTIAVMGLAMHLLIGNLEKTPKPTTDETEVPTIVDNYRCRMKIIMPKILNYGPPISVGKLQSGLIDKLVTIKGNVISVRSPEIVVTWITFQCRLCHKQQVVKQGNLGLLVLPTGCSGGCKARSNFNPLRSSPFTKTEGQQIIFVQESFSESSHGVPSKLEVELRHDLIDHAVPGDEVTITGILKARPQDENSGPVEARSLYKMYMKAVTLVNADIRSRNRMNIEIRPVDLEFIEMVKNEPNLFRLLVHSMCPKIFGHEMVKAGLILAVFGGTQKGLPATNHYLCHVLMIGDPGLGKSQLLQSCAEISPRGVFVAGGTSSQVGLTAIVRNDKKNAGSVEAGAVVMADNGVACIDEFDKMGQNALGLLEVMAQQEVSIAKAGVLCKLPARTTIIAAANPVEGHYNPAKTFMENVKLIPALLSRFDLIFVLRDIPNEKHDRLLARHIQKLDGGTTVEEEEEEGPSTSTASQSLFERLKLKRNETLDRIPQILIQKYVNYARKTCHPLLSKEAAEFIAKCYHELRSYSKDSDAIPVTARQLFGLIRLSQARARLELSDTIRVDHVQDIFEIIKYAQIDSLRDAEIVDRTISSIRLSNSLGGGKPLSTASAAKKILEILRNKYAENPENREYSLDELKDFAKSAKINVVIQDAIDMLNNQGYLLYIGRACYRFLA